MQHGKRAEATSSGIHRSPQLLPHSGPRWGAKGQTVAEEEAAILTVAIGVNALAADFAAVAAALNVVADDKDEIAAAAAAAWWQIR